MTDEKHAQPDGPVDIFIAGPGAQDKDNSRKKPVLPEVIPILPLKDVSLFPRMALPMVVDQKRHHPLVDQVVSGNKVMGLVGRLPADKNRAPGKTAFYPIGVAALVLRMTRPEEGGYQLVVQGLSRFRILEIVRSKPFIQARVEMAPDIPSDDMETRAMASNLRNGFHRILDLAPNLPDELAALASNISDPGALCDMAASALSISPEERQKVMQALSVKRRLTIVNELINREVQVLELGSKIQSQVKDGLDKSQREYYLRQQLKAIKKELGEDQEDENTEITEIQRKLDELELTEQARAEADREITRLARMHPSSSEYHVITSYLDWITALPWGKYSDDEIDIAKARKILEEDHYDLDKVKKRILEYLAVRKLNPDMKGPILCLAGPPGVGKTSLGRSVARAMGREFVRIALGGVRDEAEIRGHRRTYVGAMPGRIIQSLRRAGTANPVFMLDEVDKLGADFRGDPTSALLEVLDPEQNFSYTDHYLDLDFDLSKVFFIATANVLDTIPPPLRDRMEILEIPGYTTQDKLKIAKKYLVPRQRGEHGLMAKQFSVTDAAIRKVIENYTREAGLRNLEREIAALCRNAARAIAEGEAEKVKIGPKDLHDILGAERISPDTALRTSIPGVATGLAWTPTGGDILFVEASGMPGKGHINLTGQLGDVMKESAQAAVTHLRSRAEKFGVDAGYFTDNDIHIHVPAGAIPKDGPSAGVTMFTSLLSLLTGKAIQPQLAMTGEITLRGMVLPVGGIKEKVLAAKRAGVKTVILPARNERDLEEVPEEVRKTMKFVFAERVDQVAQAAIKGWKPKKKTKAAAKAETKARANKI